MTDRRVCNVQRSGAGSSCLRSVLRSAGQVRGLTEALIITPIRKSSAHRMNENLLGILVLVIPCRILCPALIIKTRDGARQIGYARSYRARNGRVYSRAQGPRAPAPVGPTV